MSSPRASGGGGLTKGSTPPVTQVLHNSELLTNVLRFVDNASWKSLFLVEKAWLPIATKYRCRKASFKVIKWERDSFWHTCVLDSVREIRSHKFSSGHAARALDPKVARRIHPLFDRFPILRLVEFKQKHSNHRTPTIWATWAFDRSTGEGHFSILHQKRANDDHTCLGDEDDEWDDDWDDPDDHRHKRCLDCCIGFLDVQRYIRELKFHGWTVNETVSLLIDGSTRYPFGGDDNRNVTAISLDRVETNLAALIQLCCGDGQSSTRRSITSVTANNVASFDLANFIYFGKCMGEQLRHLHVYHDPSEGAEGERLVDLMIYGDDITFSSLLSFEQLGPIIDSITIHYPHLCTATIPLQYGNSVVSSMSMPLPTSAMASSDRTLRSLNLKIRGETYDEFQNAVDVAELPLLAIARNLVFIADARTEIVFQHFREVEEDRDFFGWEALESEAAVISDIISFIRSLPDLHLGHILHADLAALDIGPNDHQEFVQLTFGSDGRPIPRSVQRAMDRYANLKTAWCDARRRPSQDARAESSRQKKLIRSSGHHRPSVYRRSNRKKKKTGDLWDSTDEGTDEVFVELKDLKAEVAALERELVQQTARSVALAEEEARKLEVAEAENAILKRQLLALRT